MDPSSRSIASGPLPTVDERAELTGQYTMASPEVKVKRKEEEVDVSYLSVKKQSKIERCTNKSTPHQGPTKLIVVLKWATTLIFAAVLLASLVLSKITLFGLVQGLKIEKEVTSRNYQAFFMCLITLVAPNVISLLRSIWNIIGRSDIPWPNKKAVGLIALTAALESTGLCIVIFKTLASGSPALGISAMQIGFVLPILFHIKKGNRDISFFRTFSLLSMMLAIAGVGLVIYIYVKKSNEDAWSLVGVIIVFLSMLPYLNKKIYALTRTPVSTVDQPIPTGSINRSNSSGHFSQGPSSGSDYNSFNSMSSGISIASTNTEPDPINNITSDNAVVWKILLISSLFKIVFIFAVSSLLVQYGMGNMNFIDAWNFHLEWDTDGLFWFFIVHITTSVLAYVTAVFACHTCMDRGAFVIPLIFSSPVSCVLLVVSISCTYIRNVLDGTSDYCESRSDIGFSVGAMVLTTLSICLVYGRLFWSVKRLVLLKEIQLFWLPTYNSVMLEQWMYLNRKLSQETEDDDETLTRSDEKTRVYICTTMYRESRKEMQQLLESIGKISQATSDKAKIHFESHIFLDGAVRGDELTEFALQLISLLKDALHIDDILTCTKTATPYGLRLGWKLPGPCGMTFTIHMKDPKKVKKKKRWSQIMYMSYVLDFLSKQHVDRDGNPIVKESDCFILTTDADVKFTPESVEALLDLMKRDNSVGAVCARTYPLGEGPLVWYQKFEYAIGHWFQKAAEHVLGSVLCAPGCFSVYRCSALKDIIPTYASSVERAFEFLIKDMGEDRWLCTLMVQSGWRIEYCAASENETYCPEEFEEFYKQRRRWIASTLANIISLIKEWSLIRTLNHRVSYLFCIYQIFLLTSTFIGPSTVIIIVAGGLNYAWDINVVWAVVLQILVCVIYAGICLFMNETWQMQSGKIITFLYAIVMTAVVVGIAEQVAEDLIAFNPDIKTETKNNITVTITTELPAGAISDDFPVSFVTLYLGLLIAVFLLTGMLHPSEFSCLLNGITYLLCLPSGYLVLNIYSVVNITDRSWGTREEKEHNSVKKTKPWYDGLETVMRKIFFCFDKKETQENPSNMDMQDEKPKRRRSESDSGQPQNLSKSLGPGFKFGGKSLSRSQSAEQRMEQVNEEEDEDVEEESYSDEEDELYDELDPTAVEEWLPKDMKEYAKLFKDNGYENTNFLSMLTEVDLKRLGIKKVAQRRNLYRKIQNIPEFTIPVDVPKDLSSWLHQIGLEEYKANFRRNQIKTVRDMEALKSFTIKEINEDLNITKPGHVRRLQDAIKRLRNPTHDERVITKFKEEISQAFLHDLRSVNQEENKFWKDLIRACLEPASDAFGFEEILKGKLQNLRNEWLMVSGIVNCLWIVIIMTLSSSIDLQIAGTNPLSLLFLIVFGFLFVLQFSCMLVHRFTTLSHFIARAPYKFGQNYRSSVSFLSRDIDSEEELLTREVRNLEPQFLKRIRNQQKQGKRKKSNSKSSETAPLIANHNSNDIYTGPPVKAAYEENMLAERGQYDRKV